MSVWARFRIKTKSGDKLKGLPFAGRDVLDRPTYWVDLETAEDLFNLTARFGFSILVDCDPCADGKPLLIVADDYLD